MFRSTSIICLALLVFFSSCKDRDDKCIPAPNTADVVVDFVFEDLQDSVVGISSKKQLVEFLTRHPLVRDYMFLRTEYPGDSAYINTLYDRFTNPHFDSLRLETKRVFGDLSDLKGQFRDAFSRLKYYYPNVALPKIQTVITGLDTDLLVSDSLIIIGLDFYLGQGAKYRPKIYDYLLRKYDPDDIVPSSMLIYGISDRFNKTDASDKTVLADMIAYGKAYYFSKQMLPCTPDSVLISYTSEEYNGSRQNQDLIWARFIESQVLYSTSHVVKKDYLAERPVTIQVGEKCPGRIGQWVGWEIVKKYMATHPDITLQDLMANRNAQSIFKESKYKPQKR